MRFFNGFRKNRNKELPGEFGVTGLKQRDGVLGEEFLPELRGSTGRKIYAEMRDNDPTIGALLSAIELMLRAVEWRVEASASDKDGLHAKWLQAQLDGMVIPWRDTVAEMCSAFVFGFALFEKVLKRNEDGTIGIERLAPRAQDSIIKWEFDGTGMWNAAFQRVPQSGETVRLPRDQLLLICPKYQRHNPEGRSLLRNAYTSYYHIKRLQTIEAIAIERELNGLPVVYAPSAALKDPSVKEKLDQIARDLKFNEQGGVVMPSDPFMSRDGNYTGVRQFEVKLLASDGTRAIDAGKVITRYQQDMLRAVLADFLMLGAQANGSYALAANKSELFLRSLEAYLQQMQMAMQSAVIGELWALNGFDADKMPRFVPGSVRPVNLSELGGFVSALSQAGISLDDEATASHLRAAAKLPTKG
jgi:hypothetical protein